MTQTKEASDDLDVSLFFPQGTSMTTYMTWTVPTTMRFEGLGTVCVPVVVIKDVFHESTRSCSMAHQHNMSGS